MIAKQKLGLVRVRVGVRVKVREIRKLRRVVQVRIRLVSERMRA